MGELRVPEVANCRRFLARETYYPVRDSAKAKVLFLQAGDGLLFIRAADGGTGCEVLNERTKKKGFVSREFLVEDCCGGGGVSAPWYFGKLDTTVAERYLHQDCNVCGAFLVRMSNSSPGNFAISYKRYDFGRERFVISHQKVIALSSGRLRCNQTSYGSLEELVEATARLKKLTSPCLVARSQYPGLADSTNEWATTESEIDVDELMGFEFPGFVFHGRWRGVVEAAVKVLAPVGRRMVGEAEVRAMQEEFGILKRINHPNIVQVLAMAEDYSIPSYHLVMEGLAHGTLQSYLRREGENGLDIDSFVSVATDILRGLKQLRDLRICHCDLGAHSVYLNRHLQAKVGNLLRARQLLQGAAAGRGGGCKELRECFSAWTAVETVETRVFTHESDLWSVGVTLWEMATFGEVPFRGMGKERLLREVRENGYTLPRPQQGAPWMAEEDLELLMATMKACWSLDPKQRPPVEELLETLLSMNESEEHY